MWGTPLIQRLCPYEGTQRHTRRWPRDNRGRDSSDAATSPGTARTAGNTRSWKRHRMVSVTASRRTQRCRHLDFGLVVFGTEREFLLLLRSWLSCIRQPQDPRTPALCPALHPRCPAAVFSRWAQRSKRSRSEGAFGSGSLVPGQKRLQQLHGL